MNLGLQEILVVALAAVVLAVLLWLVLRVRPPAPAAEDAYVEGLELWLAGDRRAAVDAMRRAVDRDPGGVDAYLQLGHFLRRAGDPRRAAALHRSLAARSGLEPAKRSAVRLALAEDLIELNQWEEAGELLDALQKQKPAQARFWRARFQQLAGAGREDEASEALKRALKHVGADDRDLFRRDLGLHLLDRGLVAVARGHHGDARRLSAEALKHGADQALAAVVRARAELADGEPERAAETATEGLLASPERSDLLLPLLQKALLETGHYERSVPILESACRSEKAPPSLWLALAMLHEKLGDRELAVSLLEGKAGDERLTLDAAAPFLRILVNDLPDCDFKRIWNGLASRTGPRVWHCTACGHRLEEIRWICPACRAFATVEAGEAPAGAGA